MTSCYHIHSCFGCSSTGGVLFASVTEPTLSLRPELASRVTVRVRGWGVAYPLPLWWHSAVPRAALRHLRRDATPVRRHMTPTDVNPHSTQCHKRNAFKRGYCGGQHTIRYVGYCCALRPQGAVLFRRSFEKEVVLCRSGVTNPI